MDKLCLLLVFACQSVFIVAVGVVVIAKVLCS